ncbi:MAG: aminotransferase DegT [Bacteroidetes bacterium]|nr:aminotransferase DegT [Bacteroidota bacterium]
MINVTKPYLPSKEEYTAYLDGIWERNWLTNYGPLVNELEEKLKKRLDVEYLQFLVNGTVPLQIAIKVLGITGEVITTPFSYVATTGAILWENCTPVFVDIEPKTFCIDADKIEAAITPQTSAILATHVYGFPCDVVKIEQIAKKHNLKVIYDGAHAFGVKINGKSIFQYGDISTCSFHATKLFHTVEGGAIICNNKELNDQIFLHKAFGHLGDDYKSIGINGKNSEFHAAMGLCNLPKVSGFIEQRKAIAETYRTELKNLEIEFPVIPSGLDYNYSYFPILFKSEEVLLKVKNHLAANEVNTRRYFYPSLNTLPYLEKRYACPVSEEVAVRVLCLPFYQQLTKEEILFICKLVTDAFK